MMNVFDTDSNDGDNHHVRFTTTKLPFSNDYFHFDQKGSKKEKELRTKGNVGRN